MQVYKNLLSFQSYNNKTSTSLQSIITKLLKRLSKEYKDIKVSQLPVSIGILLDKYKQLQDNTLSPTNQVILNFYGNKDKVNDLLHKIKDSKMVKDK